MASRLTVIFYIVLCLEAGIVLTIAPWVQPFGLGDWGDNYLLLYASQKIGSQGLQEAVASGWVRGAVTGVGLLNLAMAFWEIFHFGDTVRRLQGADAAQSQAAASKAPSAAPAPTADETDAADAPKADYLSHHGRRDD